MKKQPSLANFVLHILTHIMHSWLADRARAGTMSTLALVSLLFVEPSLALCLVPPRGAACAIRRRVSTATLCEGGPDGTAELQVAVRPAGAKGDGAFAAEPAQPGRWITSYHGVFRTLSEVGRAYDGEAPEYLFKITDDNGGLYIDGNSSGHFSRYFNHDQRANLNFTVDEELRRIDFYAASAIAVGDELTFDYGEAYWSFDDAAPAAGTDTRDFASKPAWKPPALAGPLPITPRTMAELEAVLQLAEEEERRAALLRCLEYFGSTRLSPELIEIPLQLPSGGEQLRKSVDPQRVPVSELLVTVTRLVSSAERREGAEVL